MSQRIILQGSLPVGQWFESANAHSPQLCNANEGLFINSLPSHYNRGGVGELTQVPYKSI